MARALLAALSLGLVSAASAQSLATDASPVAGTLTPGVTEASVTFDARATDELVLPGVDGCYGYVDPSAPDAAVEWGGGDLQIWVQGGFDATLAVYGPDGAWSCNDDSNGVLPALSFEGAEAGRYVVWVGGFTPDPDGASVTLLAGPPPPAPVLDPDAAPQAGVIEAAGGFEAEQGAITVSVEAGGPDSAQSFGDDAASVYCAGYIDAGTPTAVVDYDADGGTGVLTVGATAFDDLVLLVQNPDGSVLCNDDFNGTDPLVQIYDPESGRYVVWAGRFSIGSDPIDATLTISETETEVEIYDDFEDYGSGPFSEGTYLPLEIDAVPDVRVGANDDEGESAEVSFRPMAPNPVQGSSCAGYIDAAPTAGVTLRGDGPFAITASAADDLTLLVRTPAGGWFCSDDADALNPGVQIDAPEAGLYLVWIGAFGDMGGGFAEATLAAMPGELVVSEPDYGVGGVDVEPQSEGMYAGSEIVGGSAPVQASVPSETDVEAGGTVLNPVEGAACHGFLSATPSASVEASGPVTIGATGDQDLTLVVQAPDGSWTCSDDADGSDPRATVDGGEGTYSVWVGTYYRRAEPVTVTLRVE
ncbi:hypothetical protein [Rubrivirga marina]|uniref:hypothetical protein n=1 Tax=Rubrivirga marina TaxID=1196024 RepID=UPI0015CD6A87|nr:hypothetical protein [Rubrivirga marina]